MKKIKTGDLIFNILNYSAFAIFTLLCIYPFYYIFLCSLSDPMEVAKGNIYLIPLKFTFQNYMAIFSLSGIPQAAFISTARTIIGTAITVCCSSLLAYLVTMKSLYKRKYIYRYFIFTMYASGGLIPGFLLMRYLHLNNSFLLYVLPGAINVYFVILVKTFIEQIPPSLEESAKIDGASIFTIFVKIIWPVSLPIIATIAVFNAVGQWNSWYDNFLLVSNSKLDTLQYILLKYLRQSEALSAQLSRDSSSRSLLSKFTLTPMSVRMTITMVVTLPIIFVYPFLQKYFVKGIMMGAIKG